MKYQALSEFWEINHTDKEEELIILLTERIQFLLQHDFHTLVNIAYRLDIKEEKFHAILSNKNNQARELAILFIEREKQKLQYRNTHS